MEIIVPSINDKICEQNRVIQEIIWNIQQHPTSITINLNSEGPCLTHIGLYSLLDSICDQYQYPKNQIEILTSNLIENHPAYKISKCMNFWELEAVVTKYRDINFPNKKFDSNFKHFGNFISHGNVYRLQSASYLHSNQHDKTLQTYHYKTGFDYHREFMGIEDLIFKGAPDSEIDQALFLLRSSPLTLDNIVSYPILRPANTEIYRYYSQFFLEIVNLTYYSGEIFYTDEKIWRPIFLKTPFMVQGPANFIKNLRKLGFQTFDQWWDEGYSEDPHDCQVPEIIGNLEKISNLSLNELEKMHNEMQDILDHNHNLLLKLTQNDFHQIFCNL